jgi:RimJ/RimL family protein N-acetyltransferase
MGQDPDLNLKTNRLILRPIHEKYIDEIYINFTKKVTEFMPFNPSGNKNEIISFVENSIESLIKKTDIVFVVLDSDENFLGCCGIHNINEESVEVGLSLKEDSQSRGLGTEIVILLIDFIEQNLEINYIIYPVDKNNIKSRRIPEKLGFEPYKSYNKYKNESVDLNIIEYRKYYSS